MSPLRDDEIRAFERDGQITPGWRLPADLLEAMCESAAHMIDLNVAPSADFIPLPHLPPVTGESERVALARAFFSYATHPLLLDLVEPLIGTDIIMWASALFCKPPAVGLEVPWHQDGQYWPIRPRATVTVWIALDDVDHGNGCMRFIPGSHLLGDLQHRVSSREDLVLNNVLEDPRIDMTSVRNIELERGQVSLHDVDLVHGSQPNRSGRRRAGYAIRYMPASSLYDRTIDPGSASTNVPLEFRKRPIWLVRGTDRNGHNDFTIGHSLW